jgi:hypothetical protein
MYIYPGVRKPTSTSLERDESHLENAINPYH